MSLVSNGPPIWEQARDRYMVTLDVQGQKAFQAAFNRTDTMDDVLAIVQNIKPSSKLKRLDSIFDPIQELVPIFDIISNVNGLVGCSIWGPLKLVLQLLKKHSDAVNMLVDVIALLGVSTRRYLVYEKLYDKSPLVHQVLENLYYDLIDFCARCVKYFKRNALANIIRPLIKPFDAEFDDILANIKRDANAADVTAVVAEMEQAGIERADQDRFRKTVENEILEEAKERSMQHTERLAQTDERKEQSYERHQQTYFRGEAKAHFSIVQRETEAQALYRQVQQGDRIAEEQERNAQQVERDKQEIYRQDLLRKEADERLRKVRNWLNLEKSRDEHAKRQKQHTPGTCAWFLRHQSFRAWVEDYNSEPILWAYGKPGCGKSVLASSVVDELQKKGFQPIFFFFNSKGQDQTVDYTSEKSLLQTFLYQLQNTRPDLINKIYPVLDGESDPKSPSLESLRILFQVCINNSSGSNLFCIVDAIDECNNPQELLENITRLLKVANHLRVLFTSRFVKEVNNTLGKFIQGYIETRVDDREGSKDDEQKWLVSPIKIQTSDVSVDILSYIRARILKSEILSSPSHRTKVVDTLALKSDGMFLWARLMIEELEKTATTPKILETKLAQSPRGLNEMFAFILERLHSDETGTRAVDEDGLSRCRKILKWVTTANSALTIDEIVVAIAIRSGEEALDGKNLSFKPREEILALCGPLIEILPNNTVQVVHLSVKEFLFQMPLSISQNNSLLSSFHFDEGRVHTDLAISILTLLRYRQFSAIEEYNYRYGNTKVSSGIKDSRDAKDTYNMEENDEEDDENDDDNAKDDHDTRGDDQTENLALDQGGGLDARILLEYSARNWLDHCLSSKHEDRTALLAKNILAFLKSENSYMWLDSLSKHEPTDNWQHIENKLGELLKAYESNRPVRSMVEQIASRRCESRRTTLGHEHFDTLTSVSNLASIYSNQGRWKEAEQLQEQVVETSKSVLGLKSPETLIYIADLALTYSRQGRWKEAERLQEQVVETSKRVLGLEHPKTLRWSANLAFTYSRQGRWKEAEEFQKQSVKTLKRVLGLEHPDTLRCIANLALTYSSQGRWKEAEQLQEQLVETSKKVLGLEHPDTLICITNLASTYSRQGSWKQAEQLEERVFEASKRFLGHEHPETLRCMANLASTYSRQARWKEAEQLEEQVVETSKKVLGHEHPNTLTCIANLALTYSSQGRWKESERLQEQLVETSKKALGLEYPDTLVRISNLASYYWKQGRWEEAEQLQKPLVETSKRVIGLEHPSTLTRIANLAGTYSSQSRWKEAERLQEQVVETSKRTLGLEYSETLVRIADLALTYSRQDRWKDAEQLQEQVVEISKRVLGLEHPNTHTYMANLASFYWRQDRWKEAERLQEQVVETSKRVFGLEHPNTVLCIKNLAHMQGQVRLKKPSHTTSRLQ